MSELVRILRNAWLDKALVTATLELTYACNLNCVICYNDVDLAGTRMTRQDYATLLDAFDQIGLLNLTLSGGEPLASPDFFFIGARARELGFLVRIKSNGHAIDDAMAKKIKEEVGPYGFDISLHGASSESHDAQTQRPGSFSRLLNNLESIKRHGMRVKLNAPLTSLNEHEVEQMYDIADRLGFPLRFDPQLTIKDNGDESPLTMAVSNEGLAHWRELTLERSRAKRAASQDQVEEAPREVPPPRESAQHCGAGSNGVTIDPFGTVLPCVQWRKPMGSLHTSSLAEIWGSSSAEDLRAENREFKAAGHAKGACPGMPPRPQNNGKQRVLRVLP